MLEWLRRNLDRTGERAEASDDRAVPGWAEALSERVQRAIRAQSKASLRIDELERKLEDGFASLRERLDRKEDEAGLDELVDAVDRLVEVAGAQHGRDPGLVEGLERVVERLDRYMAVRDLRRVPAVGDVPNGTQVRIVGTHRDSTLPPGVVTRVVRSAVLRGKALVREGEVLVNPSAQTEARERTETA